MAMITALTGLALTTGAPRVIRGSRIEHVCGDPNLGVDEDAAYRRRLLLLALEALQVSVSEPTLFELSNEAA